MSEQPADPGWETTNDGCQEIYGHLGWRCENDDPTHAERGEPHTFTVMWFDPVAEPDCDECADTGQVGGQPCPSHCDAAKRLAGITLEPGGEPAAAASSYDRWAGDEP